MPRRATLTGRSEQRKRREKRNAKRSPEYKQRKHLTLDDRMKVLRLYEKVGSYKTLSELFGVNNVLPIFHNLHSLSYYKKHPSASEPQIGDIIIPSVELIINPDHRPLISAVILRNLKLLADCLCEASKREQLFTYNMKRKRIKEFAAIISDDKEFTRWVWLVRFDYKLKFASEDIPQRYEVLLPAPVNLNEIFCYCLKKFEEKTNKETESTGSNNNLANTQYLTTDFEHLKVTSYSETLELLNPIKDFAKLCDNKNGLKSIEDLKQHTFNVVYK